LANLLVRQGKIEKSLEEFRAVLSRNPKVIPMTLDLIWRASNHNLDWMKTITGESPRAGILLALFLAEKSRTEDAVAVFNQQDREARLNAPESGKILSSLLQASEVNLAREAWLNLLEDRSERTPDGQPALVWNGGFEIEPIDGLVHFDWQLKDSDYAKLRIERGVSHTGSRSLRIEFGGKDTTTLDREARQTIPVKAGARYRLECYARRSQLVSPEGPRVAIIDSRSNGSLVQTDAVSVGSGDWKPLTAEFTAPADARSVVLAIRRKPKFSYDEPTRGTVWFDDFSMAEVKPSIGTEAKAINPTASVKGGLR
jgi:hypothetical protein